VIAEPQGQFVYVLDGNGELESFKVASSGAMTASGAALNGIFLGGATGGVGDPFSLPQAAQASFGSTIARSSRKAVHTSTWMLVRRPSWAAARVKQ